MQLKKLTEGVIKAGSLSLKLGLKFSILLSKTNQSEYDTLISRMETLKAKMV